MESFIKVIVLAFIAVGVYGQKQKDSDEGRPYEFGFTIDGQQHRHEKKDERGIIQGEFGFITADGIYHVTVYATDENGDFKILSMRNLRISAPLDGSPFKGEISPEANKYRKQANLAPLPEIQNDAPPPPPQPQPQEVVVTTPKGIVKFTTQPTIKPACAGCGYITTQKPKPLDSFGPPQPGKIHTNTLANENTAQSLQNEDIPQGDQPIGGPGPQPNRPYQTASAPQSTNYNGFGGQPSQPGVNSNQITGGINSGIQKTQQATPYGQGTPYMGHDQGIQNIQQATPSNTYTGLQNIQQDSPNVDQNTPGDAGTSNTIGGQPGAFGADIPEGNPLQLPGARLQASVSSLPPINVADGAIHVGGDKKQDIPIKDKFPGMQDGLPDGIDDKDITNLLYKFHYTVGFQGHYEKGLKNGAKIGGYFVNGRDGISRVVTYIADENGYRPKVKFINIGLDSDDTPKPETEKTFGLKDFEFVWYPL